MNLEGELRDIQLTDRLIELWRQRFTGAIRFENDGTIKIVYFKEGDILSASTNDRADSVDEILMRAGKVSKEHVKQALSKRKENETLGDALLNLGFITRKELTWARRIQAINVIRSVGEWGAGSFTMVADYLPKREEGTIFPLPQLVVEMIVTDQDRGKFERALESGTVVFEKADGHEDAFRKLGLNEDAEAVMAQVDGVRPASEVAAASRQETFNAFKLLHALSVLGILQRKRAAGALAFESAGVADAADVWGGTAPQFDLDDEPPSFTAAEPNDVPAVPPSEAPVVVPVPPMPGWDEPPLGASPLVAPAPEPPAEPDQELRWGFDEAQIEASRIAAKAPPPVERGRPPRPTQAAEGTTTRRPGAKQPQKQTKKPQGRYGLLIALMVVFILAGAGYFAFAWWTSRAPAEGPQPIAATPEATPPAVETQAVETAAVETMATETAPEAMVSRAPEPPPAEVARGPAAGTRARYDAMAREFAANPTGNFTVQFAIVCEPSNVTTALRGSGGEQVWFIPITLKERSCYRMFWGRFATREEAERAMSRLPGEYRESRAAVVTIPR